MKYTFIFCALLVWLPRFTGFKSELKIDNIERYSFRPGKDFALFFAIEDYTNGWSKLSHPIDDAEAIAKDLQLLYGFQIELIRNPTKIMMLEKLYDYGRKTYAEDAQLFVFFSGHGEFFEGTKEGFIIPREGKLKDPYQDSYLTHDRFKKAVDAIPCRHILLAVDACYSGTIDDQIASKGGKPEWKLPGGGNLNDAKNQMFIAENLKYKTRLYITSGGKEQTPDRSDFALKILEALRSTSTVSPILTYNGMCSYLEKAKPTPRTGEFGSPEPGLKNFLFVRHFNASSDADKDGVLDDKDDCPDVYAKTASGCPDADGDGIPDEKDKCKFESGPESNQGCPIQPKDSDEDGIPDVNDVCPSEKGLIQFFGCPDTDGDGIPDKEDNCPQQFGVSNNKGCPANMNQANAMVFVKGGDFDMGNVMEDKEDPDEMVHRVRVSNFLIAKYEVTFEEFFAFCKATNHEVLRTFKKEQDRRPVTGVNWYDAVEYCNWRSIEEKLQPVYTIDKTQKDPNNKGSIDSRRWLVTINRQANGYRLPTEAEWEYAARQGGQKVRFGNGKDVASPFEMNVNPNSIIKASFVTGGIFRGTTILVGSLSSNALGLFDMSGNAWEWCQDWYDDKYYEVSPELDPQGPNQGKDRVCRGGVYILYAVHARVANREAFTPSNRLQNTGFRLAKNP